jgi:hypothetical protein
MEKLPGRLRLHELGIELKPDFTFLKQFDAMDETVVAVGLQSGLIGSQPHPHLVGVELGADPPPSGDAGH